MNDTTLRIALIHDWLNQVGGAEDVLTELVQMYPEAPIYTSLYQPEGTPAAWRTWPLRTLWSDKLPGIRTHHQRYLPVYPLAFGGLMVRDRDVVLSNKSGFCHGIHVAPGAVHVCYCLTPTRYVWQFESYAAREKLGGSLKSILRPILNALKRWDFAAAQRVDHFVAISTEIQDRIKQFYNRDSVVIYPPVDTKRFVAVDTIDDYFLIVSRLIPYKRIDLAVQACSQLALPLLVAGTGRDRQRLEAMAGPTVKFVGYVPDAELPELMARCRAFIFPGLEDFGIAPVQAQAAGRPVIAFKGGGALDTVVPGLSGELFETQTVETLVHCLHRFDATHYNPSRVRAHAMQFDSGVFRATMAAFVEKAYHSR